jgi:large subunit ribosomal protein L3
MKDTQVCRYLREVQVDDIGDYQVGDSVSVEIFTPGEKVDIIARSKGKGFAGVIKRHGFDGGPRTHGQSDRARAPGSIGGGTTPGKVYKGLKMAGHMGNRRITAKGLEIIKVDTDRNLLMVKGGIPGSQMGVVQIRRTGKSVNPPA